MGCITRIFSVLISIVIIFAGLFTADRGMYGGNNPEFGIPVMIIGAGLFLFVVMVGILGTKWPTAKETFVITIGVTLLATGLLLARASWASLVWTIIICIAGAFTVLCHRRIAGWVRSAAVFFKTRSTGK
jgi:O-antigen ligase